MGHDDSSLVDAYHACDVFVLPSVHEPFGIVVLEAWSCRKPVVASNAGGLKRLVTPETNGLVIDVNEPGAAEDLARRLTDLNENPRFSRELGEAGYREVMAHYTWDTVAKRLETVYQLAEDHAAGR
jgi:glycosyltransferase involved in cell wall biosynthesis